MPLRLPGFAACAALAFASILLAGDATAQTTTPDCREPQQCRQLALEARDRGAYEAFHDLAWRAAQTGRPNDPDLMYLIARAQAVSGRRRDAIVMLRRLAEAGYANDAATDDDFRRVRELPEWQYIATLAGRPRAAGAEKASAAGAAAKAPEAAVPNPGRAAAPAPAAPAAPAPVPAAAPTAAAVVPAPSALRLEPAAVEEAARFSTGRFAPGGLAYDAVSRRFLFADRTGRRVFVVGEGSERSVDLVRGDSAEFGDVTALAIDPRRGHLWVASTAADGSGGALHHLQLISGRVLARMPAPGGNPTRLSDLAVAADGTVFILDTLTPRLLTLRSETTAVSQLMPLATPDPTSIAIDEDGRVAFVAHRDGITRVDVQARRATLLSAPKGVELAGFEQLRWHRDALVGSRMLPDGSKGFVRLQLSRDRSRVAAAAIINTLPQDDSTTLASISGSDLYYLLATPAEGQNTTSVRVRRIKLQ